MRTLFLTAAVVGWLVALAPAVRADDAARAVVDQAMKAAGGEAVLAKYKASQSKVKGMFYRPEKSAFTGDMTSQGLNQVRAEITTTVDGEKVKIVTVLNGDKAWEKVDNDVEELDKDEVAELQHDSYTGWVASLVPLKDKEFTLASLGETKVDNRPAVGVKVSAKNRRDVSLFFDKETHLLVKTETRVKDEELNQEMTETAYFTEYKAVQGVRTAMKARWQRDGKPFVDMEVLEVQYHEKVDLKLFERP